MKVKATITTVFDTDDYLDMDKGTKTSLRRAKSIVEEFLAGKTDPPTRGFKIKVEEVK